MHRAAFEVPSVAPQGRRYVLRSRDIPEAVYTSAANITLELPMPLRCRALICLLVFGAILFFSHAAFAQIDTGVIVGRVVDDSSAVLPGVTVVATQDGTGSASTTVTNERGEFIFPG